MEHVVDNVAAGSLDDWSDVFTVDGDDPPDPPCRPSTQALADRQTHHNACRLCQGRPGPELVKRFIRDEIDKPD